MERPHAFSRRYILRLVGGGSIVLGSTLRPPEAGAYRTWCRSDPVVKINGHNANLYVSAYVRDMRLARKLALAATELIITVPRGVDVRDLAHDRGFGHGYLVHVVQTDELLASSLVVPVRVEARVPMRRDDVPIKVQFVPRRRGFLKSGEGRGRANAWIAFDAA
jgi:hypothetical protein